MNLYIFRHGATYQSKNFVPYGPDVFTAQLLAEGIPIIQKLAEGIGQLETDFHICSEVERCKKTAAIVTEKTGKEFVYDKRLNEFDEYHGETFDLLKRRIKNFLDDVSQKEYENVLICTHGAIIAGIIHFIKDGDFTLHGIHDYPQTGVLVSIKDKQIQYTNFNK